MIHRCRINPRAKRTLLKKKLRRRPKFLKQLIRQSGPSHSRATRRKWLSRLMNACLRKFQPIAPLEISLQILIKLARLQLRENRHHHYNKRPKTQESLVGQAKHQSQRSCPNIQLPRNCSDFKEDAYTQTYPKDQQSWGPTIYLPNYILANVSILSLRSESLYFMISILHSTFHYW